MIKFLGFINVRELEVIMIPLRKYQVYLMISMLLLVSLACNYARRITNPPLETAPQSTLTIDGMDNVQIDPQGKLRIVLTEAQITSMIFEELSSQENPALKEPQVSLRDGQMVLTGKVQQSGLNADLEMVMEVGATSDGKPDVSVVSASVGMFSLPQSMLDDLSAQIKSAFESKIDQGIDKIYIDTITIAGGEMVIEGHAR
jgi:uncharacterized protein YpmS